MTNYFIIFSLMIPSLSIKPYGDVYAPTIEGPEQINISYLEAVNYDMNYIISQFTIEDDYTSFNDLNIYFNQNIDFTVLGEYNLTLYVEDLGHHITEKSFFLAIIDDISPVILGPKMLTYDIYTCLEVDEILSYYAVVDDIDEYCFLYVIYDNYSPYLHIPGRYNITLEAKDMSDNRSTKDITIIINDVESTIWYINDVEITTVSDNYLTSKDIFYYLIDNKYLENIDYSNYEITEDNYSDNYQTIGKYSLVFEVTPADSYINKINIYLTINVIPNEEENFKDDNKKKSIIDYIIDFFMSIINFIIELIKKVQMHF